MEHQNVHLVGLKLFRGWWRYVLAGSMDIRRDVDVVDAPSLPEMASSVRPFTRRSCAAFRNASNEFCKKCGKKIN
jgi:hypothetical protein